MTMDDLRRQLAALMAEAKAAGRFAELEAAWREL